jgi:hypothetical protein
MTVSITQLGFICLFNLIGGMVIGLALRGIKRGKLACNTFFMLIWGILFGGMPILFGIEEFQRGAPFLLLAQIASFVIPIGIITLISEEFFETLRSPNVICIMLGGLFLMLGIAILITNIFEIKTLSEKIVVSVIFLLSGGAVFIFGLVRLLRT